MASVGALRRRLRRRLTWALGLSQMRISALWFLLTSLLGTLVALLIGMRNRELLVVPVVAILAALSSPLFVVMNSNFTQSLSGFKRVLWRAATGIISGVPMVLAIGAALMYLHREAGGVKGQSPSNNLLSYAMLSSPALLLYLVLGLLTPSSLLRERGNTI